jgi:hypothetical protein
VAEAWISLFLLCTLRILTLVTKSRSIKTLWFAVGRQLFIFQWESGQGRAQESLLFLQPSVAAGPRRTPHSPKCQGMRVVEQCFIHVIYGDILSTWPETSSAYFTWEWNLPFWKEFAWYGPMHFFPFNSAFSSFMVNFAIPFYFIKGSLM